MLISQFARRVEVWQRNEEHPENPKAWHYHPYGPEDTVELASLGIQLEMDDIYQDLDFDEEEGEDEQ